MNTLATLAKGIIPADEVDEGALVAGLHVDSAAYRRGLEMAESIAVDEYGREVGLLNSVEVERVLAILQEKLPAFFMRLRMDVCALYLSDPDVWRRIGFPGPSTRSGGYPDFDQPQTAKIIQLKESD